MSSEMKKTIWLHEDQIRTLQNQTAIDPFLWNEMKENRDWLKAVKSRLATEIGLAMLDRGLLRMETIHESRKPPYFEPEPVRIRTLARVILPAA